MFSGVIVFTLGKHKLANIKHTTAKQTNKILLLYLGVGFAIPLLLILFHYNINGLLLAIFSVSVLGYLGFVLKNASQQTRSNVIRILGILLIVIIYTMFLGQGGATLNLFIERIIDRHFFGFLIPTAEFYALDPVFMLTIGPLIIAFFSIIYCVSLFDISNFRIIIIPDRPSSHNQISTKKLKCNDDRNFYASPSYCWLFHGTSSQTRQNQFCPNKFFSIATCSIYV
jgi:hypothetical protein